MAGWTQIDTDVLAVFPGQNNTVYIKRDRSLWGMGMAENLGTRFPPDQVFETPQQIAENIATAALGNLHLLYVRMVDSGFGPLRLLNSLINSYQSDPFGLLSIENFDPNQAFSHSLQDQLFTDGTAVTGDSLGVLTPLGYPQWVDSVFFGRIHLGEDRNQYDGWINSTRFDWMKIVLGQNADRFLWVNHLQTWIAVQPDGSFFSFDFGPMTPVPGEIHRYDTRIGRVTADGSAPAGWLVSDRFGFIWFARDGNATWFWSESRGEWLGITAGGGIWSTAEERFI